MITVIVPAYNAGNTIEKCVVSVLRQSCKDFELLIIDDGSTDHTGSIIGKFMKKDSRVRLIQKANGGASSARNVGINNAKGEWLLFLDADDEIEENYLEGFICEGNHSLIQGGFSFSQCVVANDDMKIKEKECISLEERAPEVLDFDNTHNKRNLKFAFVWGKLFRKDIIDDFSIRFSEEMLLGEDFVFVLTYLLHCKSLLLVPNNGYIYHYEGMSKYRMNYEEFVCHVEKTKRIMKAIESQFRFKFQYRFTNIVYEFGKCFVRNLKTISEYPLFSEELSSFCNNNYGYVANLKQNAGVKWKLLLFIMFSGKCNWLYFLGVNIRNRRK